MIKSKTEKNGTSYGTPDMIDSDEKFLIDFPTLTVKKWNIK